jgi:hypothetical protein
VESTWIGPTLILGALVVLATLNVLEFRGKRKRDTRDLAALAASNKPEIILAHRQYLQTQNIEQVLHIMTTVLIALLVAVLTA